MKIFKEDVTLLLVNAIDKKEFNRNKIAELIELPQKGFGDYAFPCFVLAKIFRKNPAEVAEELAAKIKSTANISKIQSKGPYVNFFIDNDTITSAVIESVLQQKREYGKTIIGKNKKIVVEYPSPNTNKPLHLGHIRNMLLGQSLSKILEFNSYTVFQVNLNNDRGVHICQAMLAYEKFGKNRKPNKKSDHFVGDFYVLFQQKVESNPELNDEVQEMLLKWEKDEEKVMQLWKKINEWALNGFRQTYEKFGVKHDKTYTESEHYREGKEIVLKAYKDGLLEKDEKRNIIINLEKHGLPNKILLRADGTSIYITQDINLAKLKAEDFAMDKSVYVVGSEQILHFKQLFKILEILNIYKGDLYHLAHGMVYLPEGKMKSREGKVVDADELAAGMVRMATAEIRSRYKNLNESEIQQRATRIGMASLRFFILKYDPAKDFTFNPEESISFEGETGPYVQYAHARICSIFDKYSEKIPESANLTLIREKEEQHLIRLLAQFPVRVEQAASQYRPLIICRYLLDLSQSFNNFYHNHPILAEEEEVRKARLLLIEAVRQVLENGLRLLCIEAPAKM